MTEVSWTPNARQELRKAFEYIAKDNRYAARRVRDAIEKTRNSLSEFPHRGRPGMVQNTKEILVLRTPYIISYEVVGETVSILSVFHNSQDEPPEAMH